MSCKPKEVSKGYVVPNPDLTGVLVAVDATQTYGVITVFNESNQHVKVSYKNEDGQPAEFIVPKAGRSFTRVINGGLLNNSLKVTAIGVAAAGDVIINLGN